MTEFLQQYHLLGLVIGAATFIVIGLFHPVVIKCHYYFGTGCWWWFLVLGLGAIAASVVVADPLWSSVLGVLAFSSLWTIGEIFEQQKRVDRGWFPANPKRSQKNDFPESRSGCGL